MPLYTAEMSAGNRGSLSLAQYLREKIAANYAAIKLPTPDEVLVIPTRGSAFSRAEVAELQEAANAAFAEALKPVGEVAK